MGDNSMMAAYYADLGLRVTPLHGIDTLGCTCRSPECRSAGKHPRTLHGLKDGSSDMAKVKAMWARWPHANIGICTGTESGVLVIDVDDMMQVPEILQPWVCAPSPSTWRATTGRGGKHVFFRYDGEGGIQSRNGVWPKIDCKADGGYVVAPPSQHSNGNIYRWDAGCSPCDVQLSSIPDPIEKLLRASKADLAQHAAFIAPRMPQKAVDLRPGTIRFSKSETRRMQAALSFIPADDRDVWLHIGMALKSTCGGEDAFKLWDEWSRTTNRNNYVERDQRTTWASLREILPNGAEVTIGTLFHVAREHGFADAPMLSSPIEDAEDQLQEAAPDNVDWVTELPPDIPPTVYDLSATLPPIVLAGLQGPGGTRTMLGRTVDWIVGTATRPQPELALGNVLAAFGALLGRRVAGPTDLRTNLYVLGVAATGSGKEHSRRCVSKLLMMADAGDWIGPGEWKSDSGLRAALIDRPSHLCQVDEFGAFLATLSADHAPSHLVGIKRKLLELFGRANGIDDGAAYADTRARPRQPILEPNLCVYGTSTPDQLFQAVTSREVADGFLNRWLVFFAADNLPEESVLADDIDFDPPSALIEDVRRLVAYTAPRGVVGVMDGAKFCPATGPQRAVRLSMTPAAHAYRTGISRDCDAVRRRKMADGGVADLWARFVELAQKLALIKTILDASHVPGVQWPTIDLPEMLWGEALARWCLERYEAECVGRIADNQVEADTKKVAGIILKAGTRGITGTKLTRATLGMRPRDRNDMLTTLGDAGMIVAQISAPGSKGGRPGTRFWARGMSPAEVCSSPRELMHGKRGGASADD